MPSPYQHINLTSDIWRPDDQIYSIYIFR